MLKFNYNFILKDKIKKKIKNHKKSVKKCKGIKKTDIK